MATHDGHDHDNSKAARARCRKAMAAGLDGAVDRHPAHGTTKAKTRPKAVPHARKATQRVEREVISEILTTPHFFNPHDTRHAVCLNCGQSVDSMMHNDGTA